MDRPRRHFFSLHELLVMAALAALGGVSGAAVSMVRAAVHALVVLPGGMQFLAGIHILWPVLAVGLIRKPGAATITGLLSGTVELLSGNPHGLVVVAYAGLAGVAVDAVWIFLGGRHHVIAYMLAGGVGAASNVLVLKYVASLPSHRVVGSALALMAGVAFVSGMLLAGLLGWWLLKTLRLAGAVGAQPETRSFLRGRRALAGISVLAVGLALVLAVLYMNARSAGADPAVVPQAKDGAIMAPE